MTGALYVATYESRHYSFGGAGASEAEAFDVLKQGLRAHGKQYGLPVDWWNPLGEELSDSELFPMLHLERGTAYRDGSPLD